jgi:hypothetical protein
LGYERKAKEMMAKFQKKDKSNKEITCYQTSEKSTEKINFKENYFSENQ